MAGKKDYESEEMTVELELEDGTSVNCAVVTILTVEDKDYIVLLPLNEAGDNEDGEVWFYGYSENPEDPNEEPELSFIYPEAKRDGRLHVPFQVVDQKFASRPREQVDASGGFVNADVINGLVFAGPLPDGTDVAQKVPFPVEKPDGEILIPYIPNRQIMF